VTFDVAGHHGASGWLSSQRVGTSTSPPTAP